MATGKMISYPLPSPILGPATAQDRPGLVRKGQQELKWKPREPHLPPLLRTILRLGNRREKRDTLPHPSLHFQGFTNAT